MEGQVFRLWQQSNPKSKWPIIGRIGFRKSKEEATITAIIG